MNDPTASLTAWVSGKDGTNTVRGLVERTGYFWVEHIPLEPGANSLTLAATDVAGQVCSTNLVVYQSEGVLSMDPVPGEKLWQHDITVTGKVKPSHQRVLINGVEARVQPDGTWVAYQVPVLSPNGGTAVFEMTALPLTGGAQDTNNPPAAPKPQEVVSVSAGLGTNALTLNVVACLRLVQPPSERHRRPEFHSRGFHQPARLDPDSDQPQFRTRIRLYRYQRRRLQMPLLPGRPGPLSSGRGASP